MESPERRFSGQLAEEYDLITLAYPDFEEFQRRMLEYIRSHRDRHGPDTAGGPLKLLEIGTGNGFTTRLLLELQDVAITTLDNDPQMVERARAALNGPRIVDVDALSYLQEQPGHSIDVVASAFTLHNMEAAYRNEVEQEVFRVLRPGGLFVNADKYAPDGQERFDALAFQVERFFDAFLTTGRTELLRAWVVHNIADQSPRFVMPASEVPARLGSLGFDEVYVGDRSHMQAVMTAVKP